MNNAEVEDLVNNHVKEDGSWDWSRFGSLLPASVCLKIATTPPPHPEAMEDLRVWELSKDGLFSVKTAYGDLQEVRRDGGEDIWRVIWKCRTPLRINTFLWLVAHGRLLTNVRKFRCKVGVSQSCSWCGCSEETEEHVLRDCVFARIWNKLIPKDWDWFFKIYFKNWLITNLKISSRLADCSSWKVLFACYLNLLWIWKNLDDYDPDFNRPMDGWRAAIAMTKRVEDVWETGASLNLNSERITRHIRWIPPIDGCLKMNVDGAGKGSTGEMGAGGLIRDD